MQTAAVPELSEGALTLRAHRPDDEDGVLAQCSDPLVRRWTSVPDPYQRRHAREFLATRDQQWQTGRWAGFAIDLDGVFAGTVDLQLSGRAATVGYSLGPWARGRGTTVRALRLMLPWAFEMLELDVVHWRCAVGNWASRRVAWSVGFRIEGTVRGLLPSRGRQVDAWVGSLRRSDAMTPHQVWNDPPTLGTASEPAEPAEPLVLRAHREQDSAVTVAACNDPLTRHWLAHLPTPYTAFDAATHLEQIREDEARGNSVYWAISTSATGPMLGEIAVFGLAGGANLVGELGYWTAPHARGHGVATAAVRLAARHALLPRDVGGLGVGRVLIRAAEGNVASQRVALAAGFHPAGRDRRAELMRDGSLMDLLRFDRVDGDLG